MTPTPHDTFCTCEACHREPPNGIRDVWPSVEEERHLECMSIVVSHCYDAESPEKQIAGDVPALLARIRELEQDRFRIVDNLAHMIADSMVINSDRYRLQAELAELKAARQPAALAWTREPPTREGVYWYWSKNHGMGCTQIRTSDLEHNRVKSDCFWMHSKSHWYGPLPEPPGDPTQ